MGAGRYEVVIVNANTCEQASREWSGPDLLKSVLWLKRMNAQGGDIYIRPLDGPELLLVDALSAEALREMHRKGFAPAVAIETRPGRFQAWLKISDHPVPEGLRKQAVSVLSGVFPKVGQCGRLAGFTNQKAEKNLAGRQPYVLAHDGTGKVSLAAQPYLAAIEQKFHKLAAEKQLRIDADKTLRAQKRDRGRSR